ncbi:hypothetical protein N7G274_009164 [Stereocaulon virgatum]|uniref:Uncharacterized protein n=1 Tax=Stereocaulon virgatum TaxID=373712 RepID=A0ABR3ZYZ0_9LECA
MDALIDSLINAIHVRPFKRFPHRIISSSSNQKATEPTFRPSSSWILAAQMDRYSTSSAESQAEYQRTVERNERRRGRHVMKAREALRKLRRA